MLITRKENYLLSEGHPVAEQKRVKIYLFGFILIYSAVICTAKVIHTIDETKMLYPPTTAKQAPRQQHKPKKNKPRNGRK